MPASFIGSYCQTDLQTCLQGAYNFVLGLAIAAAFLMIVIGAFEYLLGAAINTKEAGKKRITGSIVGLIIIGVSGTVLYWINPDIFRAELITFRVSGLEPPRFGEISAGGSFANQQTVQASYAPAGGRAGFDRCRNVLGASLNRVLDRFSDTNIDGLTTKPQKQALIMCVALHEHSCSNVAESINGQGTFAGMYSAKLSLGGRDQLDTPCQNHALCKSRCRRIRTCESGLGLPQTSCDNVTVRMLAQRFSNIDLSSCVALTNLDTVVREYGRGSLQRGLYVYSGGGYSSGALACQQQFLGRLTATTERRGLYFSFR